MARAAVDHRIYDPTDANAGRLVGRVVARGLSDELNDRHYLVVDGVDRRSHYVEIGRADAMDPARKGAMVAIAPRLADPRAVAEVAAANGGRYDVTIHQTHDPRASEEFARRICAGSKRCAAPASASSAGPTANGPMDHRADHLERAAGCDDFAREPWRRMARSNAPRPDSDSLRRRGAPA